MVITSLVGLTIDDLIQGTHAGCALHELGPHAMRVAEGRETLAKLGGEGRGVGIEHLGHGGGGGYVSFGGRGSVSV